MRSNATDDFKIISSVPLEELRRKYVEENMSAKQIAAEYGIKECALRYFLQSRKINKTRKQRSEVSKRNNVTQREKLISSLKGKYIGNVINSRKIVGFNGLKKLGSKNVTMWNTECVKCGRKGVYQIGTIRRMSCNCIKREVFKKENSYKEMEIDGEKCVAIIDLKGNEAIIDAEDLEKTKVCYWRKDDKGYWNGRRLVDWKGNYENMWLHRVVLDLPKYAESEFVVDHINHNPSDNRKANLRVCTQMQNSWNKTIAPPKIYKGVRKIGDNIYRVDIGYNGTRFCLGRYPTPEMAGKQYAFYASLLYGEFALLDEKIQPPEHGLKNIIAFSGKAHAGKDYIARKVFSRLEKDGYKVMNLAFGTFLKTACNLLYGVELEEIANDKEKYRTLLQETGDMMRGNYRDVFINMLLITLYGFYDNFDYFLITDMRFINEKRKITTNFKDILRTVRIERPSSQNDLTEKQRKHKSETELDNSTFDYTILNEGKTEEELDAEIEAIIKDIYEHPLKKH